jgi:hypothetical protein
MTRDADTPIPDYDHLPVAGLAHRIRTLDVDGLSALLDDERAHADRVAVVQLIEQRLAALRSGEAEPSGGDPAGAQPEHAPAAGRWFRGAGRRGDRQQPATSRHGVAGQTPNRPVRAR